MREHSESAMKPRVLADYPDMLTVQDVCGITGLSAQTVRRAINSGQIPGCRIGRRLFVPKSRFAEFAGC